MPNRSTFIAENNYQIDEFPELYDLTPEKLADAERFKTLSLKPNKTSSEINEMSTLAQGLKDYRLSAELMNYVYDCLRNMEQKIKDEINIVDDAVSAGVTSINTTKDNALISIEQKKNNVIEYLSGTDAGSIRTSIGVLSELDTTDKSSLTAAINEVNQKASNVASEVETQLQPLQTAVTNNTNEISDLSDIVDSHSNEFANHVEDMTIHGVNKADISYVDNADMQNAINIAKTNFKIDSHTGASKNSLTSMVIDALNDSTGIDTAKSSNYTYESTNKSIKPTSSTAAIVVFKGDNVTAVPTKGYVSVDITTITTGDISSSAQAISSSVYQTFVAANAFDNNEATTWIANGNSDGWIGQNFEVPVKIDAISFISDADTKRVSSSIKLQYSDNGSAWFDKQTFTGVGAGTTKYTFNVSNPESHQYWRIYQGNATTYEWAAREVEFMQNISTVQPIKTYLSVDNGVTYTQCALDTLITLTGTGTTVVCKVEIPQYNTLNAIAWGWK